MTIFAPPMLAGLAREDAHLDHTGFVVPSLEIAARFYASVLGCRVTDRQEPSGQGIAKVHVMLANLKIELIEPLTSRSPIEELIGAHSANDFLRRHPSGGIHHVCYSVADLPAACDRMKQRGYGILGSADARAGLPGAIVFVDPMTTQGALIELKART